MGLTPMVRCQYGVVRLLVSPCNRLVWYLEADASLIHDSYERTVQYFHTKSCVVKMYTIARFPMPPLGSDRRC